MDKEDEIKKILSQLKSITNLVLIENNCKCGKKWKTALNFPTESAQPQWLCPGCNESILEQIEE